MSVMSSSGIARRACMRLNLSEMVSTCIIYTKPTAGKLGRNVVFLELFFYGLSSEKYDENPNGAETDQDATTGIS